MGGAPGWLSSIVGVAVLVGLVAAWVGVQAAWNRVFPGMAPGGDALAGRERCSGCGGCDDRCERDEGRSKGRTRGENER
ncbi:MAG: hypothetical protein AMXMBFR36_35190 [Acidobacteriota bacterium]